MRNWIIICILFFGCYTSNAQVKSYTFSNIEEAIEREPRPVIVFFYTDWCNYCALMKRKTFSDEKLINEIEANYYLIFFNAESKEDVYFKGHKFSFKKKGLKYGTHELAETLATIDGNLGYPTLVILNPEFEILYQYNSYIKASKLLEMLKLIN